MATAGPLGAQTTPFVDATSGPLANNRQGYGVAWGDYDNDGDLDLYLANIGANKLFRNDGGGTFVDATSEPLGDAGSGFGVAWGDYDNDGLLDLYLVNSGEANKLFRNEGSGTFVDATSDPLGDTGYGYGVAWGDHDNDGDVDLYLSNLGGPNKLFRNEGGGTFSDATSGPLGDTGFGSGVAWGDYDNDGDLDLYLANQIGGNKLFRNDGGGTFVDATSGALGDTEDGFGAVWGDYDNDGDLDLYLANSGPNNLFRNEGGGTFADVTSGPLGGLSGSNSAVWADYDNDGDLDLYLVNFGRNNLFRNDGGGTFVDVTTRPLDGDPGSDWGVAWGDYDNDGDLDLYLGNNSDMAKLLRNETAATGRNWLQVKLEGTASNWAGIGARVRVVAGGVSQIREISGGTRGLSQDAMVASFGLGSTTTVDSLVVSWPSRLIDVFTNIDADQLLVIPEGTYRAITPPGSDILVSLGPYIHLTFDTVTEGGESQLTLQGSGPPSPNGLNTPLLYFDLSTTAAFVGEVTLCVTYVPEHVSGDEEQLLLVHHDPPMGWREITTTRDPVNNVICGTTTHFGLFAVMEPLSSAGVEPGLVPEAFRLYQSRPNPMMRTATIRFDLAETSPVKLFIFDVNGRLIRTLVNEAALPPGRYAFGWDGRSSQGRRVAAGTYFYRLETRALRQERRFVVLR